ncbi:MAG TPA: N-acetylmuramoyl-L-alanine amidase [Verrucomicrobiae bacterium]|nr:N-acetylmuramoyl-L-alanine amidase [Verrucomicrobiae bacterium]
MSLTSCRLVVTLAAHKVNPSATSFRRLWVLIPLLLVVCLLFFLPGNKGNKQNNNPPEPGTPETRTGDEIVAAGQFFHTGTRVVLWTDPNGYDAYRIFPRFTGLSNDPPQYYNGIHYDVRNHDMTPEEFAAVRSGNWDVPMLQRVVDQFVIHFDVAGTSRRCFHTLQDVRGLSVQFMLDVDGTIYQTLDLKERAWQATIANSRSIGIEIANVGAYTLTDSNPLETWYQQTNGQTLLTIPDDFGAAGIMTSNFVGHPARPDPVEGNIQGKDLVQYDFTPEQYQALIKLTAALCKIFPKIRCQYPTNDSGELITSKLPDDVLTNYEGILGHYHVQTDKVDPGPAFQWDYVVDGARKILAEETNEVEGLKR